jgi:hypothetical protein
MAAPEEPVASSPPDPEAITPAPGEAAVKTDLDSAPAPPPEPFFASAERYDRWRWWLDGALVVVVLLLAFEVGLFPVRNSDLLLHRAVGRLLAQGQFDFRSDPFAFTTEGARWVDHSWLFGLFAYGMHQLGDWGDIGLIVLKSLLLAALAEIMLRIARRPGHTLWVPALCTGLAVLALSVRAFLQPVCVSYLFVGLTLYLLEVPRRRQAARGGDAPLGLWNVRWLIPLLCALWVNLDAWYILGPGLVALYLIGDLLEGSPAATDSAKNLAAVLVVTCLACLVGPYHVYGLTLPEQLGLSPAADEVRTGTPFAGFFYDPLWNAGTYLSGNTPGVHRSVAGLAYYPLIFIGIASFVRAPGSWRSWRGTVWLGFFLLSAYHSRAIPLFAVVAGPIASLNFLDPAAGVETGVPDDPDRRRRLMTVRVLTVLLGIAAFTAGSAGWLHAPAWGPDIVPDSRRPGWWEDFDKSLQKIAQRVGEWHEQGRIPADSRFFNQAPDAGNYLAWYAPGSRVFIDSRISLYPAEVARQYVAVRKALYVPAAATVDESDPAAQAVAERDRVFAEHKIRYLVVGEGDVSKRQPVVLPRLIAQSKDWTLCYLFGVAGVFGCNATAGGPEAFAATRYDPDRLAFGPDADKVPPERPTPAPVPEWWQVIWQPERPRSAETDNAGIHVVAFEEQANRRSEAEARAATIRVLAAAGNPVGPLASGALTNLPVFFSGLAHDPGPPADLYLAVRAARRALHENPEDGHAWYWLGRAYWALNNTTREQGSGAAAGLSRRVRQVQIVAALTRAVQANPDLPYAHALLADHFRGVGFFDLTLRHREAQLRAVSAQLSTQSGGAADNPAAEAARQELQVLTSEVQRLQQIKKDQEDRFELDSASKPPLERAQTAINYRLAEPALKAIREHVQQIRDVPTEPGQMARATSGVRLAVRLLVETGELDEARVIVQSGRNAVGPGADPDMPVLPGDAADWFLVLIDAAAGDYADADTILEDLATRTGRNPVGRDAGPQGVALLVPEALGQELLREAAVAGRTPEFASQLVLRLLRARTPPDRILPLQRATQHSITALSDQADLQTMRAWLALEAGHTERARKELADVTERAARPYAMLQLYETKALAELLLGWLRANEGFAAANR